MTGGSIASETGSNTTGVFVLNGNLTYNSGAAATISGLVNLNAGARTITVNDGPPANDLTISAQITGAAGSAITKSGNGALLLTNANNNYPGTNNVQRLTFTRRATRRPAARSPCPSMGP